MKRHFMRLVTTVALSVMATLFVSQRVEAYNPQRFVKYDATVTDSSLLSFANAYDTYIPAGIRMAFESEGGIVYVIPHNVVDPRVNLSGWDGGSLENVTGYLDPNGAAPKIYLNSKVVDNASRYNPGTSDKVVIHEMGHFVHLKANKIRNGRYSYNMTPEMSAAFHAESANPLPSSMPEVLKSSFQRNRSTSEFYANLFAAIIIDPVNAQATYPRSCQAVCADVAAINAAYMPALEKQAQQMQAAQAAAIAQAQAAQAAAIQQAQAAQAAAIKQAQQMQQAQAAQVAAIQQAQAAQAAAIAQAQAAQAAALAQAQAAFQQGMY